MNGCWAKTKRPSPRGRGQIAQRHFSTCRPYQLPYNIGEERLSFVRKTDKHEDIATDSPMVTGQLNEPNPWIEFETPLRQLVPVEQKPVEKSKPRQQRHPEIAERLQPKGRGADTKHPVTAEANADSLLHKSSKYDGTGARLKSKMFQGKDHETSQPSSTPRPKGRGADTKHPVTTKANADSLLHKSTKYNETGARSKMFQGKDHETSQKHPSTPQPAGRKPRDLATDRIKDKSQREQPERKPPAERRVAAQYHSNDINPKQIEAVPNRPFLDLFNKKVQLTKSEIKRNSALVNGVISELLEEVHRLDSLFCLHILHAGNDHLYRKLFFKLLEKNLLKGSYYENLKVCRALEFDIMVFFKEYQVAKHFQVECPTRGECVGFAKLKYQDWVEGGIKWRTYLTSDRKYLSPVTIRQRFLALLRRSIRNQEQQLKREEKEIYQLSVEPNGPAAKVTINGKIDVDVVISLEVTGWPACAKGWGDFASTKTWPTQSAVEKIKIVDKRFYLVAKDCDSPSELATPEELRRNWRISFSEAEKHLLRPASENGEKKCYRIVKCIFEAHRKELNPLSSYYLKTLFFHKRTESAGKDACSCNKEGQYVVKFLVDLKRCVQNASLQHFFVTRVNLLSRISKDDREKIVRTLQRILRKLTQRPFEFLADL